jgi:hypothetical protein
MVPNTQQGTILNQGVRIDLKGLLLKVDVFKEKKKQIKEVTAEVREAAIPIVFA